MALKFGLSRAGPVTLPLALLSPQKYSWLAAAWDDHLQNLKEIKGLADQHGSKLLVVLIPSKEQVYEFLRPAFPYVDWRFANGRLKTFFTRESIDCVDLTPIFVAYADHTPRRGLDGARDLYWEKDSHWNPKGNRLAGLAVAKEVVARPLIPLPDADGLKTAITAELTTFK